ncbi:MAG: helix-turn-helix transcriptional regulator [Eggerthellaceae bacterium]|nr:helix-turn-helix transcriptional regulator [Eggerthellaceae bacterium]
MNRQTATTLLPTVCVGALLLLWYKRMMIAMPAWWGAPFIVACAAGFVACGIALDRTRVVERSRVLLGNQRIVMACAAIAGAGSLGVAVLGQAGVVCAAVGGIAAAAAFLATCAGGLRALPPNVRGCAFAAIFFLAGFVNTSTDLAELPWLKVAGFVPNAGMAAGCAALAAIAARLIGAPFNTRILAVPDVERKGALSLPRLLLLTVCCFVLMYVAVSLKDSVAYPVAVESIVDSGFVRYVELPMWVVAGVVCDRVGRSELFALCTLCAFVGSAGLIAEPHTSTSALCTLCSYFCLIGFPTACVCLAVDISCYVARPAYVGAFCFAPVVVGAAVGAGVTALVGQASGDVLFLASTACLALFSLCAAFLLRGLRSYRELLATTPVIALSDDGSSARDIAAIAERFGLTRRETEVLELVFRGLTVQQMADELVVSKSTVKFHVTNILRKTSSESRQQMIERLDAESWRSR